MSYTFVLLMWFGYKGVAIQGFETLQLCEQAGKQLDNGFLSGYKCHKIQLKEVKERSCGS